MQAKTVTGAERIETAAINEDADKLASECKMKPSDQNGLQAVRAATVRKVNEDQAKAETSRHHENASYRLMGQHLDEYFVAAKAKGEKNEHRLYMSLVKDQSCKVKKGALYNAHFYFETWTAMASTMKRAPDLPMTHYVKVRHKALSIEDKFALLKQAEDDKTISVAKLNSLVKAKLVEKGVGKPKPVASDVVRYVQKAMAGLTKASGLIEGGSSLDQEALFTLNKIMELATRLMEGAKS